MSALDIINANGQDYDIMSPEVVSDYVEKIGTICKNPNGYTKGSLFLARDAQNVERMYKATSAIASNQTITSGTNCTVKKLGDLFNDVDSDVSQVKQALSDEINYDANTGVKNLWNIEESHSTGANANATRTYSNGTIVVNCAAQLNSGVYFRANVLKEYFSDYNGVPLILSFEAKGDSSFSALMGDEHGDEVTLTTSYQYFEVAVSGAENIIALVGYSRDAENAHTITMTNFMCRYAGIMDRTYQPYAKPNTELTKDDNGLTANEYLNGAVNLLNHTVTNQTITANGSNLTIIVNEDKSITVNGTTGTQTVNITLISNINLNGRYKYSGCPSGGGELTYNLQAQVNNSWKAANYDYGNGVTLNGTIGRLVLHFHANQTISNVVFKPMITVADMPNSDYAHYVPYRMSNGELTDALSSKIQRKKVTATLTANTDILSIGSGLSSDEYPISCIPIFSAGYLSLMNLGIKGYQAYSGENTKNFYMHLTNKDTDNDISCDFWVTYYKV